MEHGVDSAVHAAKWGSGVQLIVCEIFQQILHMQQTIEVLRVQLINSDFYACYIYTVRAPSKPALDLKPLLIRNCGFRDSEKFLVIYKPLCSINRSIYIVQHKSRIDTVSTLFFVVTWINFWLKKQNHEILRLFIINCSTLQTAVKNGVKDIQTVGYNGARMAWSRLPLELI